MKIDKEVCFLSGNQAIAFGAIDCGLNVATGYPGTPSTEIIETLKIIEGSHKTFWHSNEKTALEMALGAALHKNTKALATMKHVGLNVAADAFKSIAVVGITGALVLVVCDDMGMYSSQNEFDSRNYAAETGIIVFEPSDSQESYNMVKEAFLISETIKSLVMVRMTTRTSHSRGIVKFNKDYKFGPSVETLQPEASQYVVAPTYSIPNVKKLFDTEIPRRRKILENHRFNYTEKCLPDAEFGIITSGVAYNYVIETLKNDTVKILKLGVPLPLPVNLVRQFAKTVKKLVVINDGCILKEELEINGIDLYRTDVLPKYGELTPDKVNNILLKLDINRGQTENIEKTESVKRPPVLCPGCPYRSISLAIKLLNQPLIGDIGCYTLTALPPLAIMKTAVVMGASIPMAEGSFHARPDSKPVCMIGDGTFLHSGITGLISAVNNSAVITIIILDNNGIAMTGNQETAFSRGNSVDMVKLIKSIGVKDLCVVDAHDYQQCVESLINAQHCKDLSVIIVSGSCIITHPQYRKNKKIGPKMRVNDGNCTFCLSCLKIGCPSISISKQTGKVFIDDTCVGCSDCVQLCKPCPSKRDVLKSDFENIRKSVIESGSATTNITHYPSKCSKNCSEYCSNPAIVPIKQDGLAGNVLPKNRSSVQPVDKELFRDPMRTGFVNYNDSCDIFIGSVGGQGGVTSANLIAHVVCKGKWDCKVSEIHGMAQKGGIVTTHVRSNSKKVLSPIIHECKAHVGLFFEPFEGLRWQHMVMNGGVLIINSAKIIPPIIAAGDGEYPNDPISTIKNKRPDLKIISINIYDFVDNPNIGGAVLLGILSNFLPFKAIVWQETIKLLVPPKYVDKNIIAFEKGRNIGT